MTKRTDERCEFLADVLTTAVEGGIGYWAEIQVYAWRCPGLGSYQNEMLSEGEQADALVVIQDTEHDELPEPTTVTPDTIAKGIGVLDRNDVRHLSQSTRARLIGASRINDAGEIDAGDADVILQLGVFGEVIYG